MKPELQFFIGKGGVGKSTTSALTAAHLSQHAKDTLLVSMDPAHNQRDIFQQKFSEKPRKIHERLSVKEVDVDYWMKKYLKETEKTIQQTYSYEGAFNLQKYFHVLRFSPGLEEYALLLAFENIIHTHKKKDVILFDMAPTALTLRFFSLPFITLIWLEELLKLRNRILKKKEIVSKIKIAGQEIEQDKVKARLYRLIQNYEHLREHFLSPETKINLVMNDDNLSLSEAFRIKSKLKYIGMHIDDVIVNKARKEAVSEEIREGFSRQQKRLFPLSESQLLGYEALQAYVKANQQVSFSESQRGALF